MVTNQSKAQLRQRNEPDLLNSPFSEAHAFLRPFYKVYRKAPLVLLVAQSLGMLGGISLSYN